MKRTQFSGEQIIGILEEAKAGVVVTELCRKPELSCETYNAWKARFDGLELLNARRLRALQDKTPDPRPLDAQVQHRGPNSWLGYATPAAFAAGLEQQRASLNPSGASPEFQGMNCPRLT